MLILHIAEREAWREAQAAGSYEADSLTSEGFIHCSKPEQISAVANRYYRGRTDLVLLYIESERVNAEIRYENLEGGEELFPHIYGPLNLDAVIEDAVIEDAVIEAETFAPKSNKIDGNLLYYLCWSKDLSKNNFAH